LGTDYLDLFQLHVPDPNTPLEETARALDYVIKSGMVRYAGYSNFPAWQAQKLLDIQEFNGMPKVISAQMYYSLMGRDIEENTVQFLEANNIGLMTWSPLAGGFLSGKYTKENPVPDDSRRAKFDFPPVDLDKGYEVVAKLKEISEAHNASIAQVALAWQLAKPFVSSVIIGANKMSQLEDNLGAVKIKLSDEEVTQLDELSAIPQRYPAYFIPFGHDQKVMDGLNKN
jgi:aryl-alcohol dehydrogenase-like predicted oxidoreductase